MMTRSTADDPRAAYARGRHGIHNLNRRDVIADPSRYVDAVRELGPLFFDEVGQVWVCSGYAQAAEILTDFRRFSSVRSHPSEVLERRGLSALAGVSDMLSRQMLFSDPPSHTELRSSIRDQFLPARVRERDGSFRDITSSVLAALPTDGSIDLVADFAERLPSALVATLLGITDRPERLSRWADAYERLLGSLSTLPDIRDRQVITILDEAMAGFRDEALARLEIPGDDLISSMVADLRDRTTITAEELDVALRGVAANCVVLTAGGYQTLTHLVTSALLLLDRHPPQRRLLREKPELIDSAINEVMRVNGSSQYVARHAVADIDLPGARIRAGQTVVVLLAAANLDPAKFTDPDVFRIDRDEGRHLGFGLGRHYCVGAPYAERMARWAVLDFLDRYPNYRFDTGASALEWGKHANTRCLAHARVLLEPAGQGDNAAAPVTTPGKAPWQDDTHRQVVEWNDTLTPLGPASCWHQVFEQRAVLSPDAVAVVDCGIEYSYGELDERANAVAMTLRERGVQPECVVGVLMSRSVRFVIAVLAIGKAGGAFMLADRDCPAERLRVMVQEANVQLLLVDESSGAGGELPTDHLLVRADARAASPPVTGVVAGNTGYVVFTSGTTGRPKGIAVSHEAMVNLHIAQRRIFHIGSTDRVFQFFSPNFDGCVFDLVMSLLSGAALVIPSATQLTVGPAMTRLMAESRATVVTLTPSVWAALPVQALPQLRIAATAGERLPAAIARRWAAPGRRVLNLYGPAETAVWATWHECDERREEPPIGRPVANKRVYLLDEHGRTVPVGDEAELHIGGIGVGRYLGRPDLMEDRFRPDPFCGEPGRLLYRTGDICRWRSDGVLEYVGRRDRQTKIRGQRVELDEVERVLEGAPGVLACGVHERDAELTAVVVAETGEDAEKELREYLAERLHSGMVPARFMFVNELPRTLNGKLSREPSAPVESRPVFEATPVPAEPQCAPTLREQSAETVPFATETRLTWRIARFFAACLNLPQRRVRSGSDFFTLGGDSLAIAELLTSVEEECGVLLDVDHILDEPTPAGISAYVLGVAAGVV